MNNLPKNLIVIMLLLFASTFTSTLFSQNVSFEVKVTKVRWDAMGDQSGGPDPTWKVWARDNIDASESGGACMSKQNISTSGGSLTNWDGPGSPYTIRTKSNTSATTIYLRNDFWEDDCPVGNQCDFDDGTLCSATKDDEHCTNGTLASIAFRSANPCTVYYYPGAATTSGSASSDFYNCGKFGAQVSVYWYYADAPTILTNPVANTSLCPGQSTTLSFTTNNDAQGRSMGRLFQWQISRATDCTTTPTDWSDITGATSATYVPNEIAGTRLYRCKVSSSCSDINATFTYTSCARVTYNPMDGRGSFTHSYGTGDNAPAIQSGICGITILPGSTHTLNALLPPSVGAATNLTGYTWSASGGTITGSGSSVSWQAPTTAGSYTISLTYNDGCAGADATVTCTVTVGYSDCDFVYVSNTNGTNTPSCGGPDNPCKTLTGTNGGLSRLGSKSYIRMTNDNYTETGIINMSNNLVIEGGYDKVAGVWVKSSNSTTNLSCSGFETVANANGSGVSVGHRMGVKSDSKTGWKLIDLNITTTAVSEAATSTRGNSNYGLWIYNSSGYEVNRCNIIAGNAGNGSKPAKAATGHTGATGNAGVGDNDCNNEGSKAGGSGASTNSNTWGGNGGTGGAGGTASTKGTNANGAAGTQGGNSGGAGGTATNDVHTLGCCGGGTRNGANGNTGTAATGNLSSYTAGDREPANHTYGQYLLPGIGSQGGAGRGGGGGGGGASSTGERNCCCCAYNDNTGNGGGQGGQGGGGGQGGFGGGQGGFSFAVFVNSGTLGTFNTTSLSVGSGGTGGDGGDGGDGGAGGAGGDGPNNCSGDRGDAGQGGTGGMGSAGGRGRDGANGGAVLAAVNGTSTSLSNTVPSTPTVEVKTGNGKICKNSVFTINNITGSGNWATLPTGFSFTDYNNDASPDYGATSYTDADVSVGNGVTAPSFNNLGAGSTTYNSYLWVAADARPITTIQVNATDGSALTNPTNTICNGGQVKLVQTSSSYGTPVEYKWEVYSGGLQPKGSTTNLVFSSAQQSPTTTAMSPGNYFVRYQVKELCCGWSVPAFATFTVNADPTVPTGVTASPTVSPACAGTLSVSSPTGITGGLGSGFWTFEYDLQTPTAPYNGYGATNTINAAIAGSYGIKTRVQAVTLKGCDESPALETTWDIVDQPSIVSSKFPNVNAVCEGADVSANIALAGGTGCTDVIQYRTKTGTAWSSWSTYVSGDNISTTGFTEVEIQAKRGSCTTGAQCIGTNSNAYTTYNWLVTAQPISGTITASPNVDSVCAGTNVSATFGAGSLGGGCSDIKQYRTKTSGVWSAWATYTPGNNIATTSSIDSVQVSTTRGNCTLGTGCYDATPTIKTWEVVAAPDDPSSATKTPNATNVCIGDNVSVSSPSGGQEGVRCSFQYRFKDAGSATWSTWGSTNTFTTAGSGTGSNGAKIQVRRGNCFSGCTSSAGTYEFSWDVDPKPTATPVLDKLFTCDASAFISASALTSGATVNWTRTAGSSTPASGSGSPLSISGLAAGTTTYSLEASKGACIDIPIASVNIVMPTVLSTSIANVNSCGYCVIADGNNRNIYNDNGDIIATIVDDNSGIYTPAKLDSSEVCVRLDGSVQFIADNEGFSQPYLQRQWTIHPKNNTNATVTLYFKDSELQNLQSAAFPSVYQFSGYDLWVTKYAGGSGGTFTPPCTGGTPGCGQVTGVNVPAVFSSNGNGDHKVVFSVNTFSTFYIHPNKYPFAPLPVELISFVGWNQANVNKLQWITASERNTLKYEIQKNITANNARWEVIGNKAASGNSVQQLTYDFTDNNPTIGNNYYRLKIIDRDGTFSYSNTINIPISEAVVNNFINVYPNPTGGNLNVEIQATEMYDTKVLVYDVVGKKVFDKASTLVKGFNALQFDFSQLSKGTYILQFSDKEGKLHTAKFVKD